MPRQARLDAPGTLHHVMIRGIERSPIFKDDQDREDFISRMGLLAQETGTRILAWALMRNHVHLLFFSGPTGISQFMRRLLTGYALRYKRRHRRNGHLFQNRYNSIICEEGKGQGRRPELVVGGLIRSLGGCSQVLSIRSSGETMIYVSRLLGSGD